MRMLKLFVILVSFALIAALTTTVTYVYLTRPSIQTIAMDVNVADIAGINVDTDALHFGSIMPGGGGFRIFNIKNSDDQARAYRIAFRGDLAPLVYAEPAAGNIAAYESVNVSVHVAIPPQTPLGLINGEMQVILP